jgi:hypothetical protein
MVIFARNHQLFAAGSAPQVDKGEFGDMNGGVEQLMSKRLPGNEQYRTDRSFDLNR